MPNQIIGTVAADIINGTAGDDLIDGLAGFDQIYAGDGNDVINGGLDTDLIYGGLGNDVLNGDEGDDLLLDPDGGNDSFFGGTGNDTIQVFRTNIAAAQLLFDGGTGNDLFLYGGAIGGPGGISYVITGDTITASGGDGEDRFDFQMLQSVTIDAGTGADHVQLDIASTTASVTLGAGADIFEPRWYNHATLGTVTIQDFQAGAGGDRMLFDTLIAAHHFDWSGTNPFGSGLLSLVQAGADTLVQFSDPGSGRVGMFTILTLKNVTASALNQENLGFNPSGGVTTGAVITGTAAIDHLRGFGGNDTITGLNGNDWIEGFSGNDTIDGGEGNDTLDGGYGDDLLHGDSGDDSLTGNVGSDSMFGDDGNDGLFYSTIFGPPAATVLLDGGAGNDSLSYFANQRETDTVTASGGTGNDQIRVGLAAATAIFGGDGNDAVFAELLGGSMQVSLGLGIDTLIPTQSNLASHGQLAPVVVTDFTAGAYGDTLLLHEVMASRVLNWDGVTSPFDTGHLRLIQQGADTLVQIDRTGGGDNFQTFMILSGVAMSALAATQVLWKPGFNYSYGTTLNDFIPGSAGTDFTMGQIGDDTLSGADGDDTLIGDQGNDSLYGDAGRDRLFGGDGDDTLYADNGDILIDGGAGTDKAVFATSGTLTGILTGIEAIELQGGANLTLTSTRFTSGLAFNSAITGTGSMTVNIDGPNQALFATSMSVVPTVSFIINGSSGVDVVKAANTTNTINGGAGTDQLRGGNLADTIDGGGDGDKIIGFGGADFLTGGGGNDQFRYLFATDSGTGAAADRITDFVTGSDKFDFRLLDSDPGTAGVQLYGLSYIGATGFHAAGGAEIRYATAGADLRVELDLNGDGLADMHILLSGLGGQTLSSGDFLI